MNDSGVNDSGVSDGGNPCGSGNVPAGTSHFRLLVCSSKEEDPVAALILLRKDEIVRVFIRDLDNSEWRDMTCITMPWDGSDDPKHMDASLAEMIEATGMTEVSIDSFDTHGLYELMEQLS